MRRLKSVDPRDPQQFVAPPVSLAALTVLVDIRLICSTLRGDYFYDITRR